MQVGDWVRPKHYGFQHLVGVVIEYKEKEWNVVDRYLRVKVVSTGKELNWPDQEFEVISDNQNG